MDSSQFLRICHIRAPNMMWLLGAGASAAGGIPTAGNMIWDFKRLIYCSEERKSLKTVADLNDVALRARLQAYFQEKEGLPAPGADDEYAAFFEAAYPSEGDRRNYIDRCVTGGRPSFGHDALARLLLEGRVRVVWTTNFDRLVEDAAFAAFHSSSKLITASIDSARVALEALNESRWPLLVKLHGDFQSRRLKNTSEELRHQDAQLRHSLVESCKRFGLAVIGYSGRDASVMSALEEAAVPGAFPAGLFWLQRGDTPTPAVARLLKRAQESGIDAHVVQMSTFDEAFADLLLLEVPEAGATRAKVKRVSDAPRIEGRGGWPVIRTNALKLDPAPASCRLVECDVGGTKDARRAVADAGVDVVVQRRKVGVLAFGRDADVRKAFEPFNIRRFDLHPIHAGRLAQVDSAEKGLLYDALARALARHRPLIVRRRGRVYVAAVDPGKTGAAELGRLRAAAKVLSGVVPETGLRWSEAARLSIEYRLDSLWLLFEPTIAVEDPSDRTSLPDAAKLFVRERIAARYNRSVNEFFDSWATLLAGGPTSGDITALGISDGVDATFRVHATTAFSRKALR